jgi:hypothetical protein
VADATPAPGDITPNTLIPPILSKLFPLFSQPRPASTFIFLIFAPAFIICDLLFIIYDLLFISERGQRSCHSRAFPVE